MDKNSNQNHQFPKAPISPQQPGTQSQPAQNTPTPPVNTPQATPPPTNNQPQPMQQTPPQPATGTPPAQNPAPQQPANMPPPNPPAQPPPPTSTPPGTANNIPQNNLAKTKTGSSKLAILWTALIMFVLGVIGGIALTLTYPTYSNQSKSTPTPKPTSPPKSTPTPTTQLNKQSTQASTSADLNQNNASDSAEANSNSDPTKPDWKTYKGKEFTFKYPKNYTINDQDPNEISWNTENSTYEMVLRSQDSPFPVLNLGSEISIGFLTAEILKIQEEKQIKIDNVNARSYRYECGEDCLYTSIYFKDNDTYYELTHYSSANEEDKTLSEIISTLKFTSN